MKSLIKKFILLTTISFCIISCERTQEMQDKSSPDSLTNQQNNSTDKIDKTDTDNMVPVEKDKKNTNIDSDNQNSKTDPPERFEDLFPK